MRCCLAVTLLSSLATAQEAPDGRRAADLLAPVRLEAAGAPIESGTIGHAAPLVGDFDDDGIADLLVGQFEAGRLVIYRNTAKSGVPQLEAGRLFQEGRPEGTVPTG